MGTVTGGRAEMVARGLSADRYRISVRLGGSSVWLSWTYKRDEAEWFPVVLNQETVVERTVPARGMLRGTIRGSWQELDLSPPWLTLFDEDSTDVSFNIADAEGNFALWIFAPVRGKASIHVGGVQRWHGGDNFGDATEFSLEPGRTTEIEIVESGIAGYMNRAIGPHDRPRVWIGDAAGATIGLAVAEEGRGFFRFANLVPGSYTLYFEGGPAWITQWYGGSEDVEGALPVEISEVGEVVRVDAELDDGGSLTGQVLDPAGDPLLGVRAYVVRADADPQDRYRQDTSAGAEGSFHMAVLPDGDYKLGARSFRYGEIWYPGVAAWDSAGVITLDGHPDLTGFTIRFP
jgi:hypothetical protein